MSTPFTTPFPTPHDLFGPGAPAVRAAVVLPEKAVSIAQSAEHSPAFSTNERAERLMGRRDAAGPVGIFLDWPVELGYQCPVLGHQQSVAEADAIHITEGGPNLHWSEYSSFVWCEQCNRDYPSALCTGLVTSDPAVLDRAISVYLDTIQQAQHLAVSGYVQQLEEAVEHARLAREHVANEPASPLFREKNAETA